MQECEHEPQVRGDGRLPREQLLDPLVDREVEVVDVVVERDHLVGELRVLCARGLDGGSERPEHELALGLQPGLELLELLLEGDPEGLGSSRSVR